MKRIIYEPAVDEDIPNGKATVMHVWTISGIPVDVIDVIVDASFTTAGTLYYDSTIITPAVYDEDGILVSPAIHAVEATEPFIHHFAEWENK